MDVRALEDSRSDAELVAAAVAGDRGAFAAIYDRYADRLHDFCWSPGSAGGTARTWPGC